MPGMKPETVPSWRMGTVSAGMAMNSTAVTPWASPPTTRNPARPQSGPWKNRTPRGPARPSRLKMITAGLRPIRSDRAATTKDAIWARPWALSRKLTWVGGMWRTSTR